MEMRHGVVRVDGLKAERGPSLITFNGPDWKPTFTAENGMIAVDVAKASGVKVYVRVNNEWVEVDEIDSNKIVNKMWGCE
jgi:hypothetical protein